MKIKLTVFIFLLFSLNCFSQKTPLKNFLPYMGYPDLKLGINFTEFNQIVQSPIPCVGIDYNRSFRLDAPFASKFLNFSCDSYYSFNKKDLLTLVSWEIYHEGPNQDSGSNNLIREISAVLGKPNGDNTYNDPSEVRKVVWAQDGLGLTLYYRKEQSESYIDLTSSDIRSNGFGVIQSITSFFKQKRISYKYEKEHQGETFFGGRIVGSIGVDYTKKVNTPFVFIRSQNGTADKLRIGNNVFKIFSIDTYSFQAIDNKGNFFKVGFFSRDPLAISSQNRENEILVEYDANNSFRYYFKNP